MPNQPKPWWREVTRGQWAAFSAAWLGWVLDAFDFTIYLLVMKHIAAEFHVGIAAVSGSITLTLLVRLLGGGVAGWMADRWGRKLPLMLSLLWFAIFDSAIFFAPSFVWILVLRTLFGFGMGAEWTAGTALAMESFPPRGRKFASGLLQAGWPVGFLLAALTAYFVVPALGWRAMFLIAAVPALLVIPIRMMVPAELSKGESTAHKATLADLAEPKVVKMMILGSLVMALGFIVYYGLTAHYTLLQLTELGLDERSAFVNVIIFNSGMLVGVVLAGIVANRYGVIAALVIPALLMVPALPLFVGAVPQLIGLGAFLGGMLGVGYSGVTPVLTTSLFPAHVRARAIGIVYHAGALIAAFVPWGIPQLSAATGMKLSTTIGVVVGAGLVLMASAVLVLRRQLTLPEDAQVETSPAVASDAIALPSAVVVKQGLKRDARVQLDA
jgi:MFS transporter, SHS family, lactate transporter